MLPGEPRNFGDDEGMKFFLSTCANLKIETRELNRESGTRTKRKYYQIQEVIRRTLSAHESSYTVASE